MFWRTGVSPSHRDRGDTEEVSMHRIIGLLLIGAARFDPERVRRAASLSTITPSSSPERPRCRTSAHPVSLLVGGIGGADIYRDTPIVYRIGANQVGVYQFSRWAEPPVELLKNKLIREVDCFRRLSVRDWPWEQFRRTIHSPAQDSTPLRKSTVRISPVSSPWSLSFMTESRAKFCGHISIPSPNRCKARRSQPSWLALDTNLDRGLKEVAAGLSQYFSANPPV